MFTTKIKAVTSLTTDSLECSEIEEVLKNYRVDLSKDDLWEMFSLIDTNNDGRITFDEFFSITTDPLVAKGEQ